MRALVFCVFFLSVAVAFAQPKERPTTADLLMSSCSDKVEGEEIITSCDEEIVNPSNMMQEGVSEYCLGCKEEMIERYSETQVQESGQKGAL